MSYRDKVVAYAKSQIGVCEPRGDDKYIKEYNRLTGSDFAMNVPWCMIWVSCCMRAAKVPETVFGNYASCTIATNWAKKQKIWYSRLTGHKPRSGELVIFDWGADGVTDHVGIVKSSTTNSVVVIEGNAGQTGKKDGVYEKTYSATSKVIMGYIDVQYPDEGKTFNVKVDAFTKVGTKKIETVQKFLNKNYKAKLAVDGIAGLKTMSALVKAVQMEVDAGYSGDLDIDGIWGPLSANAFRNVSIGKKSALVSLIQCALVIHGADIKIDGDFGNDTFAAVKQFQADSALKADGIVGKNTIAKLLM